MNDAFRKSFFDNLGLVSLIDHLRRFQSALHGGVGGRRG
jgi:hypothetical protein